MKTSLRPWKKAGTQCELLERTEDAVGTFHWRGVVSMVSGDRVPATWTLDMFKTHVARTWPEQDAVRTYLGRTNSAIDVA